MAVSISRSDGQSGPVRAGAKITLQATADPLKSVGSYEWEKDNQAAGTGSSIEVDVSGHTVGKYTVLAKYTDGTAEKSLPFSIALTSMPAKAAGSGAETETPAPVFHVIFAGAVAVLLALGTGLIFFFTTQQLFGIARSDWIATNGHLAFAASLTLPALLLGGATLAVGLFMALVEWRGRFRDATKKSDGDLVAKGVDPEKIIEAVGKLQGAALVLVVGGLLMLGSVWVASSAAGSPPAPTPSPAPK
jgi:hypothetical protein